MILGMAFMKLGILSGKRDAGFYRRMALIGYGLLQGGLSAIKRRSLVPEKTVQSLKEDKQWLTNQTK